jgi:hypothetical protein
MKGGINYKKIKLKNNIKKCYDIMFSKLMVDKNNKKER